MSPAVGPRTLNSRLLRPRGMTRRREPHCRCIARRDRSSSEGGPAIHRDRSSSEGGACHPQGQGPSDTMPTSPPDPIDGQAPEISFRSSFHYYSLVASIGASSRRQSDPTRRPLKLPAHPLRTLHPRSTRPSPKSGTGPIEALGLYWIAWLRDKAIQSGTAWPRGAGPVLDSLAAGQGHP